MIIRVTLEFPIADSGEVFRNEIDWDVDNTDNEPFEFATSLCAEYGLNYETVIF